MKTTVVAIIAMVLMAFCVMPVAASNADNDLYTSKYADIDPGFATTGGITGAVRCHDNLLTKGVTITDPAGIVSPLELRADGTFDLIGMAPGKYVINIADGNGGQPEQATVTVRAGYISFLESELLGHAVDGSSTEELDTIVVLNATYGMQTIVIDSPAVPGVPGVPATPDTYVDVGQWHGDYKKFMGHYYFVGCNMGKYDKIAGTPAIPAIPAIPAVTHIEGQYADVRADVQAVIDGGAREFMFDNSKQGIYTADGATLLKAVADPAVGQVKSVVINVEINGVLKTINTMEYETITI